MCRFIIISHHCYIMCYCSNNSQLVIITFRVGSVRSVLMMTSRLLTEHKLIISVKCANSISFEV